MTELRRQPQDVGTAARATAARLREEILAGRAPGTFLGSEDDLLSRLGVSRPTLRQAARILEHEDLLSVRRGKNGGLFARLPTSDTLAHVASVVLRAQGATIEDLTRMNALIAAEAARLATTQASPTDRQDLAELVHDRLGPAPSAGGSAAGVLTGPASKADGRRLLDTALAVNQQLARLSGSPALALFASVLAGLAHTNFGVRLFADQERITETRLYLFALSDAVATGRADEAARLVASHHERLLHWLARPTDPALPESPPSE